ncbi:MAG: peroxiredoxin 2/4 [Candidatus Woesearchaeota archaeon]|nr:peroxiredoxin 2/4 [Candidatus Woesearchaeota archaeon]
MTEEKESGILRIGDKIPNLTVNTTHGKKNLVDDYKGKWLVLFSHPGDFTPVCTTEFYGFQKRYDQFKEINTELLGLSVDQVFSHLKWTEWIKENLKLEIKFPIIADERGIIAETFGMISPKKGTNTVRAVFIIDDKSIIRVILYYPQEIGRNVDEIIRTIKALQESDKYGVAIPHNWPDNELIKDKAIVHPAASDEEIEKRKLQKEKGEIECYDWWLCYKSV